ncbi:MAG: putative DNA binding domain-containing protein [Anaerolinea sp.]|nr:putative DNA binding domain-containing protein [Anaerolinea sp.]
MIYNDAELELMLADLESDLVERKETFKGDAPTAVREAVCAFANDLPNHRRSGVVFIGARDDGTPSGLPITDELLRQLADIKTDGNIMPPPSLSVAKQQLKGVEMAVITVLPADSPPVRHRGRVWIRIGPRRGIASAQDERILNEKRRHRDRPFDVQPMTVAAIEDLDQVRFQAEYLRAAVPVDILEANDRSPVQQLAATKMIVSEGQPIPTVLGLLVVGKTTRSFLPGAYVQFLRIQGVALDEPIVDEELIDGTVADMVRRLEEKLIAHNRTRVDFVSGPQERRTALYPLVALQQLGRNAILHRSYEATNAPVRVYWYDDRIEISSPGGPYGQVTVENFGAPGLTDYRNPNLAEAMHALGFVQRFGGGIVAARTALQRNGNPPPEFRVDQGYVLAIVRPTQ